jgi:hypothetical protein
MNALNQKQSAAQSTLQNLGNTILGKDRSDINDLISGAKTDVSNLSLGGQFDPTSYSTRANTLGATDISGFEGALRNAAGNTQFADIQDLINAGGAVQGAQQGPATLPIGGPGAGAVDPSAVQQQQQTAKRGLGNTGAF